MLLSCRNTQLWSAQQNHPVMMAKALSNPCTYSTPAFPHSSFIKVPQHCSISFTPNLKRAEPRRSDKVSSCYFPRKEAKVLRATPSYVCAIIMKCLIYDIQYINYTPLYSLWAHENRVSMLRSHSTSSQATKMLTTTTTVSRNIPPETTPPA